MFSETLCLPGYVRIIVFGGGVQNNLYIRVVLRGMEDAYLLSAFF